MPPHFDVLARIVPGRTALAAHFDVLARIVPDGTWPHVPREDAIDACTFTRSIDVVTLVWLVPEFAGGELICCSACLQECIDERCVRIGLRLVLFRRVIS